MAAGHWLIKSEPSAYSYDQLVKDGKTAWTGVRNFAARNNLRAMHEGDTCLFYHSSEGKAVVGVARVARVAYPDPTARGEGDWSAVDVAPVRALGRTVTLEEMKADKALAGMMMIKRPRLSVSPVTKAEFDRVMEMGRAKR
jgi:predicted RNA-binding protein with PUA-like domain